MNTFQQYILVFIGGGFGSVARFSISLLTQRYSGTFPSATFISNVGSSLLFGIFLAIISYKTDTNNFLKIMFLTGFCGGFSTYSTFTFDNFNLFKNGNYSLLLTNIFLHTIVCLVALWLGLEATKKLIH